MEVGSARRSTGAWTRSGSLRFVSLLTPIVALGVLTSGVSFASETNGASKGARGPREVAAESATDGSRRGGDTTTTGEAPEKVAVEEEGTTATGEKSYQFQAIEVEGRLKAPQILYFLRRVRAELRAGRLGHRSFLPELQDTRRNGALR